MLQSRYMCKSVKTVATMYIGNNHNRSTLLNHYFMTVWYKLCVVMNTIDLYNSIKIIF